VRRSSFSEVGQRVTFELGQDPKSGKDESRKRENIVNVKYEAR